MISIDCIYIYCTVVTCKVIKQYNSTVKAGIEAVLAPATENATFNPYADILAATHNHKQSTVAFEVYILWL